MQKKVLINALNNSFDNVIKQTQNGLKSIQRSNSMLSGKVPNNLMYLLEKNNIFIIFVSKIAMEGKTDISQTSYLQEHMTK